MTFNYIFSFKDALILLKNTLVPFAQQNTEHDTGVPDKAAEMGFNGQIGNIEDPSENRGVSGIQLKRSFYNIYLKALTAAVPVLVDTLSTLYQFFIRDYCMNDRRYAEELKDYYRNGDVVYTEKGTAQETRFQHNQLVSGVWQPVTLLHDRGKTVLGYPTVWPGTSVPSWAIDIGSHDEYSWTDYPVLENNIFKAFLTSCEDFGAAFDEDGFTSPDLRGISPAVWMSGIGGFLASNAGQHSHKWGSVLLQTAPQTASHTHTAELSHNSTSHTHTCNPRKFSNRYAGGAEYSLAGSKNSQSHNATTLSSGDHRHVISVNPSTENHRHTTESVTLTPGTTPAGNSGTVTRVNTYPVHLIVRVE